MENYAPSVPLTRELLGLHCFNIVCAELRMGTLSVFRHPEIVFVRTFSMSHQVSQSNRLKASEWYLEPIGMRILLCRIRNAW